MQLRCSLMGAAAIPLVVAFFCLTPTAAFLPPSPALFHARPLRSATHQTVVNLRAQVRPPSVITGKAPSSTREQEIRSSVSGMVPVTQGASLRYDCKSPTL